MKSRRPGRGYLDFTKKSQGQRMSNLFWPQGRSELERSKQGDQQGGCSFTQESRRETGTVWVERRGSYKSHWVVACREFGDWSRRISLGWEEGFEQDGMFSASETLDGDVSWSWRTQGTGQDVWAKPVLPPAPQGAGWENIPACTDPEATQSCLRRKFWGPGT